MDDFYGRQSEGPSAADLLAYYDPSDEVISPVRVAQPVPGTKSPAATQMRFAPADTPGRRRGPGGAGPSVPERDELGGTQRPSDLRRRSPPRPKTAHREKSPQRPAWDDSTYVDDDGDDGLRHEDPRPAEEPTTARRAVHVNPEDLPAGIHQRAQLTASTQNSFRDSNHNRSADPTPRAAPPAATAAPRSHSGSHRSQSATDDLTGSAWAAHQQQQQHQLPHRREGPTVDSRGGSETHDSAVLQRVLQELEEERDRAAHLEAKLEEAASRADAASAAAIDMQAQLQHAQRAHHNAEQFRSESPRRDEAHDAAATAELTAEVTSLKARVEELEALLEKEREEHRLGTKRLIESTSDDVAAAHARARDAEAESERLRGKLAAQATEVEVAQARAATLARALEEERQDSAALAASFRSRLAAAVEAQVVRPAPAPTQTAYSRDRPSPGRPPVESVHDSHEWQPQASQPQRSPPRADAAAATHASAMDAAPRSRTPPRTTPPVPASVAHATPDRVPREASAVLRTPPRQTPRVPTAQLPAAGVQSPPSTGDPSAADKSPTRAGHAVRDKNATAPAAVDPREVESLEARLFELCRDRDATDQQLRRVENVRVRSLADKAKKDNLVRRLAELNGAVSDVRKRLRELSALER